MDAKREHKDNSGANRPKGSLPSSSQCAVSADKKDGEITISTLSIDVLDSMLELTADDLLKVFRSKELEEDDERVKACILKELENLKESLLSASREQESTKGSKPHTELIAQTVQQTSSSELMPSSVEASQYSSVKQVKRKSSEYKQTKLCVGDIYSTTPQIGMKRPNQYGDHPSPTPAKVPRFQKSTKKKNYPSMKTAKFAFKSKPLNKPTMADAGIRGFSHKTPTSMPSDKSICGHAQKLDFDKQPTLNIGTHARSSYPSSSNLPAAKISEDAARNTTAKKKPRTKCSQLQQKRPHPTNSKTKGGKMCVRRSRCSAIERHLCSVCSLPDCGKCKNCLNKDRYHKACLEKPIENCRKYIEQSVSHNSSHIYASLSEEVEGLETNSNTDDSSSTEDVYAFKQHSQLSNQHPYNSTKEQIHLSDSSETSSSLDDCRALEDEHTTTKSSKSATQPPNRQEALTTSSKALKHQQLSDNTGGSYSSEDVCATTQHSQSSQLPQQAPLDSSKVQSQQLTEISKGLSDHSATLKSPDSEDDFHSKLDRALKDVHVKILTAKCGVFGPSGSGKSHFKAIICGKKRPIGGRQSTAIAMDAVQMTNFNEELVEMHRTRGGSNVRWFVTDNKKLALLVANTMYDCKNPINLSVDEKRRMTKTRRKILKDMTKLVSRNLKRNPKGLRGMRLIYLVDTGGQPQFQEIMPMFVRSSSVHFLVHKLNESLNDCPPFDYEIDGEKYHVPEEMLVSNKVYLEQSLRTISSCNFSGSQIRSSVPKPQFAVIGMFKDLCDADHIDEKQKAVNDCITPFCKSKKCVAITPSRHPEKPVFAIDGSEEGWSTNGDVIDKLHICIENFTEDLKVEIPIRWFLFLNILKEKSTSMPFISLQDCYKLAVEEDILMDEEDVDKALELFDELNLVLHFRKFLPGYVFISPEFLLKKVTKILVQSFDCSSQMSGITPLERLQFRTTGIINKNTIKKVNSLQQGFCTGFTLDILFDLLENLCIIAKIGSDRYFIPCVLALERDGVNSEFLQKISDQMYKNGVEPLVISFSDDYSPRGLFCASISFLANLQNWEIESHSDSYTTVRKRNLIKFEVCDNTQEKEAMPLGCVVIVDRTAHFEVFSTCNPKHLREIRRTINEALWNVAVNCLDYSPENIDISFGFSCDFHCGKPKPHGTHTALEDRDNPQWSTKCIKNKSKHAKQLNEKQLSWFSFSDSEATSSTESSTELTTKLLMEEVAPKTNEWQFIALRLDFEPVQIECIERQERGDIKMCFLRVFNKWKKHNKPPFTWQEIIKALKSSSVGDHNLADYLKKKYLA